LKNIREDDRFFRVLILLVQKIEGDAEGVDVGIVAVVDQGAVVDGLFEFEAEGDGGQAGKA
jgi:hypothetical protein